MKTNWSLGSLTDLLATLNQEVLSRM